jgi:hypothetical protein
VSSKSAGSFDFPIPRGTITGPVYLKRALRNASKGGRAAALPARRNQLTTGTAQNTNRAPCLDSAQQALVLLLDLHGVALDVPRRHVACRLDKNRRKRAYATSGLACTRRDGTSSCDGTHLAGKDRQSWDYGFLRQRQPSRAPVRRLLRSQTVASIMGGREHARHDARRGLYHESHAYCKDVEMGN